VLASGSSDADFYTDLEDNFKPYYWMRVAKTGTQIQDYVTSLTMTVGGVTEANLQSNPAIGTGIATGICNSLKATPELAYLDCSQVTCYITVGSERIAYTPNSRRRLWGFSDVVEYFSHASRRLSTLSVETEIKTQSVAAASAAQTQLTTVASDSTAMATSIAAAVNAVDATITSISIPASSVSVAVKSLAEVPTAQPTLVPSPAPTSVPSAAPTANPSESPTDTPTLAPTGPTPIPTPMPTPYPTASPTDLPTTPTDSPTMNPTQNPTNSPTMDPEYEDPEAVTKGELAGAAIAALLFVAASTAAVVWMFRPKQAAYKARGPEDPVTASQIEGSLVRMQEV
jgi:hypothetical protein